MTVQMDLIRVREQIAAKRTRLNVLHERAAEDGPEQHASSIKSANKELNALIDEFERIKPQVDAEMIERAALKAMRQQPSNRQIDPNDGNYVSGDPETPRGPGPDWAAAVLEANDQQSGMRGTKSLLSTGTAVVGVPVGGPIEDPRRARFLSELMPAEDAPGGHFSYLRQSVRTSNAAVVAEGAVKPTSVYTLVAVDGTTKVVAHLSEAIPRFYLDDSAKVRQFIEGEMRLGVDVAVDARIVSTLLGTAGILAEGALGTTDLFTTRRAITRLEEREVTPSAWAFHPRDWEQIEHEMTTVYAANSNIPAPSDEIRRSLHGLPVFVSMAVPENTGIVGDFRRSAVLYRTDGVRIDWSEAVYDSGAAATDWSRNLLRMRAETRIELGVLRPFAFCTVNIGGTGS